MFFNPDNVFNACTKYKENEVAIKQRAIFFSSFQLNGREMDKNGCVKEGTFSRS